MLIVGLTGLIGSGKSTVANLLANLGATIIDTDEISQQLTTTPGPALNQIVTQFGPHILTAEGLLDRVKLRNLVFNDGRQLARLEAILHPLIYDGVLTAIQQHQQARYLVLVVPLLFKSPRYLDLVTRTLFVDCAYPLLIKRLEQRSGLSPQLVDAILARQVERERQLQLADDVISNNGDLSSLQQQVEAVHQHYLLLR